jgi:hypothetical protein
MSFRAGAGTATRWLASPTRLASLHDWRLATHAGHLADARASQKREPRCMENTASSLTPVLHDIDVLVVSAEEASFGVAEFWSGGRQIGFTRIEDGELALRIGSGRDNVVVGTHALTEALAKANRLLALY